MTRIAITVLAVLTASCAGLVESQATYESRACSAREHMCNPASPVGDLTCHAACGQDSWCPPVWDPCGPNQRSEGFVTCDCRYEDDWEVAWYSCRTECMIGVVL